MNTISTIKDTIKSYFPRNQHKIIEKRYTDIWCLNPLNCQREGNHRDAIWCACDGCADFRMLHTVPRIGLNTYRDGGFEEINAVKVRLFDSLSAVGFAAHKLINSLATQALNLSLFTPPYVIYVIICLYKLRIMSQHDSWTLIFRFIHIKSPYTDYMGESN